MKWPKKPLRDKGRVALGAGSHQGRMPDENSEGHQVRDGRGGLNGEHWPGQEPEEAWK